MKSIDYYRYVTFVLEMCKQKSKCVLEWATESYFVLMLGSSNTGFTLVELRRTSFQRVVSLCFEQRAVSAFGILRDA